MTVGWRKDRRSHWWSRDYGDAAERRSAYAILLRSCELWSGGQVEEIKRLDALLEYAVMHGDEKEAERIREELRKLTDEV